MDTKKEMFVKLNLRGKKFLLNKDVYCKDPTSKLYSMLTSNDSKDGQSKDSQVYLDRNPVLFPFIMDYYSQGFMHYPSWLCAEIVKEELCFWQLEDKVLASCCWHRYQAEIEDHKTLTEVRNLLIQREKPPTTNCKERLHAFLTNPHYSKGARVWSVIVLFIIVVSVLSFMLETLPVCRIFIRPQYQQEFQNLTDRKNIYLLMHARPINILVTLEIITTVCLTIELLLKFFSAPHKCQYIKKMAAISDFLGVFPVWIMIILTLLRRHQDFNLEDNRPFKIMYLVFNCFRLFRLFRFILVMTHIKALMLFYLALKASAKALGLLLILLFLLATIAANLIYFAEIHLDNFSSVFSGVWWAYITMTTVGYGDIYPVGTAGCIVGILCAMTGILVIAMPVPVIVNNFSALYDSSIKVNREEQSVKEKEYKQKDKSCQNNKIYPANVWTTLSK